MNRILRQFTAILCLLGGVSQAISAEAPAAKVPQPDRWLLVVDTSAAMERRARAVEGVLGELLASGMHGELKPGAEIGIWTFNKELSAGVAPLQLWEPAKSNLIAGRTVNILAAQKFRDKSRLRLVLEELQTVVAESRRLTVVLLSDGSGTFTNTPFDDAVNAAVASNITNLTKTRMPLVTVLRSEKGKYIGHNVSMAPWPVEFPAFAPEPKPAPAPKPEPPPTNRPPREIHISAKPKPEAPPTPTPAPTNPPPTLTTGTEPAPPAPPVKTEAPVTTNADVVATVAAPPVQPPPVTADPTPPSAAVPATTSTAIEPVAPATLLPETRPSGNKWPLFAGVGFMMAAALIALLLALRGRRQRGSSLITRSFDRQ